MSAANSVTGYANPPAPLEPRRPTVEVLADELADLMRERDELRAQVASSVHQLVKEARAWMQAADVFWRLRDPAACEGAHRHAAALEEFVRSLSAEPTEPSVESEQEQRRRQGEVVR